MERNEAAAAAVALRGWVWRAGMATMTGGRVTWVDHGPQIDPDTLELRLLVSGTPYDGDYVVRQGLPNPDDAATAGVLLSMLGRHVVQLYPSRAGWTLEVAAATDTEGSTLRCTERTLGRAVVCAAGALGGWPTVAP